MKIDAAKFSRRILRSFTVLALAYASATVVFSAIPAHLWLPTDKVVTISGAGCGSGRYYLLAVEDHDAQLLPVVLAKGLHRGEENAVSQRSCDGIAAAVREEQPILSIVPQRFLCQEVRRHVRGRYLAEGYTAGPPLLYLVDEDEVVGSTRYDEVMATIGLVEGPNGLEPL